MLVKKNNALIWNLLIFVSLPLSNAKVYLVTLSNRDSDASDSDSVIEPEHESLMKRQLQENSHHFLQKLVSVLAKKQIKQKNKKNKCIRLFGSIYGTKNQRLKCQERVKSKGNKKSKLKRTFLDRTIHEHWQLDPVNYEDLVYVENPLLDLIKKDSSHFDDVKRSETDDFSTDYIDFRNLKSLKLSPSNNVYMLTNYTKLNAKPYMITKRNMIIDSSDDFDSDESVDPKRFQIINNKKKRKNAKLKKQDSESYYPASTEQEGKEKSKNVNIDSDSSSVEYQKPKRGKIKKQKYDSDYSESVESVNPKIGAGKKVFYLQGNTVIDPDSDEEFRRRLSSFLPKRYHWDEDDIHSLGYYWFNGPQGRYPYYAVRP